MYILNRRHTFHSNVYETRLFGKKAICMGGKAAAEIFYDTDKFKRAGAAPNRIQETLFGKGAVQGLDNHPHHHRKKLFMSMMTHEQLSSLADICSKQWEKALIKWEKKKKLCFIKK
ncbi:hypothetical protein [Oceanobacillus timonensis]|uniref:hypothetical protein n=1 Tax=Oceanobacillus timonensis TaxID=1926285 RepID=UPI0009BA3A09|nr:hypothetical protein [Oceanobacillus timonensis]